MKKYSIIKFGSQLNSHFDKYSDKDLLIVSNSKQQLPDLYDRYTKAGWSVSSYTYSKLEYLSKKGSLFINHLIKDSEVLYDYQGKFKSIIGNHITKRNYDIEIDDSKKYFEIVNYIPDIPLGYAWFVDCFYVGLRNYLIFINAKNNIFEFSYLQIIKMLLSKNIIDQSEYEILKQLRVLKYNYRENYINELPSREFVESLIKIAQKLNLINNSIIIQPSAFDKEISNNIFRKKLNGYQRLRLVEGIYCSKNVNMPEIKRIISNPQFYASKLINNDVLMKLIDTLNNNTTQHARIKHMESVIF